MKTLFSSIKKVIAFCLVLNISFALGIKSYAQSQKKNQKSFEKAVQAYRSGQVNDAIKLTEELILQDSSFINAILFLADIYAEMDSTLKEIKYLNLASHQSTPKRALINYRLGEAFFSLGNYVKAKYAYTRSMSVSNGRTKLMEAASKKAGQCNFAINSRNHPQAINMKALGPEINTALNEYWPSITVDGSQLIFTRLIPDSLRGNRLQEDFYLAENILGEWELAQPVYEINTFENEGAQSISADGKLLVFSACNRTDGYGSCDIYVSVRKNGSWQTPVNAGPKLNTRKWESQPSLSPNTDYLYFSSNREGGFGANDIWRIEINGLDESGYPVWGQTENLGDSINTIGSETSPFIHFNDKILYFSSDGWLGFGKSDIFFSTLNGGRVWSKPVNVGYPINSHNDEKGFIVDASGEYAYFSSEQGDGKGIDIFSAQLIGRSKTDPVSYVKGKVVDSDLKKPLIAEVEITNLTDTKTLNIIKKSGSNGEFLSCLPLGAKYAFNVSKKGYLFYSAMFSLDSIFTSEKPKDFTIELLPLKTGNKLVMRNLYFKTDSFRILNESYAELKQLLRLLEQNPEIRIEVGGHTDNVGKMAYNQLLSEKRAMEVKKYLISNGINEKRVTAKGYGEESPIGSNETSDGRGLNRRTEITVL